MNNGRGCAGSWTVLAALRLLDVLAAQNPGFDCRPASSPLIKSDAGQKAIAQAGLMPAR